MDGDRYNIHFEGLRKVVRNPVIAPAAKALLINLILYAGSNGHCFPEEMTLANDFALSDRQIRRLLTELFKNQVIRWRRGKLGQSNRYSLSPDIYFLNKRTPVSVQTGQAVPVPTGHVCPTNVIIESNHLKGSQVRLQFEETFKKKCTPSEISRLKALCSSYSSEWVASAIKEAQTRHKPYVNVGLIALILEDWKRDGKPEAKPKLVACGLNGCLNGYIFNEGSCTECECLLKHKRIVQEWEQNNRGTTQKAAKPE